MTAPHILRLTVERFRGLEKLVWHPKKGVNLILGGGDAGKTTILDAVALLLAPTNYTVLTDADYHHRKLDDGFSIEAVMSLPPETLVNQQTKPSWPWEWNGTDVVVPALGEGGNVGAPVYVLRVAGSPDLELSYEIVQPNGERDPLTVGLRRAIGLVRLSGDDRNDRDLRLVQGSALDRLLSDRTLRSRLGSKLAKSEIKEELNEDAKATLTALDERFKTNALPHQLDLAVTGAQGVTITALIGLTADEEGTQLPLASWGAGTRRLAALAIAEEDGDVSPITLVDEVERGLEPYRQRLLMAKLQSGPSQAIVTTHSAPVIAASTEAALWYVDHERKIGPLGTRKIAQHQKREPETFLARLAIVAEGATEIGFVTCLLEKALGSSLEQHGIRVSNGDGNATTLDLLEDLADGGLTFGGFADNEGTSPDRWRRLEETLGGLLFRWQEGCLEENIIAAVPEDRLEALITDPADERTGMRLRTLADRLGADAKDFNTLKKAAGAGFAQLIIAASTGSVPDDDAIDKKAFKAHAQTWFKSIDGGRELAEKVLSLGLWPQFKDRLMPFANAVRRAVGLADIDDLPP